MSIHSKPKKIYPYRCKVLSMDLLSIFHKYHESENFIEPLLNDIKNSFGSITENDVVCISEYLNISENKIRKTVESNEELEIIPVKQHIIRLCKGDTCKEHGAEKIIEKVYKELKIISNNITEDGKFRIEITGCLNMCDISPVIGIDNIFYGKIDIFDIEALIGYIKEK